MKRKTIVEIISTLLVMLFAYTAASKLLNYHLFLLLSRFQPLINKIPATFLWLLPIGELAIVFMLMLKKTKILAFYIIAGVSLFGIIYRIIVLSSGRHLPCLCGPYLRNINERNHIYYELMVLIVSILAIYYCRTKRASLTPGITGTYVKPHV